MASAPMILADLPEEMLTKIFAKLNWYGQDCMLIVSKPTRSAVQSIVRAVAQKNSMLKLSMHMLSDLVSQHIPCAGLSEKWCDDTFYTSTMCVRKKDESDLAALVELDRKDFIVTASLVFMRNSMPYTVFLHVTDAPEAGFTRIPGRETPVRPFKSLSEARGHVLETWESMGLFSGS
jgi:hypothetical protein